MKVCVSHVVFFFLLVFFSCTTRIPTVAERKLLWSTIKSLALDLCNAGYIDAVGDIINPGRNTYVYNFDFDPLLSTRGRALFSGKSVLIGRMEEGLCQKNTLAMTMAFIYAPSATFLCFYVCARWLGKGSVKQTDLAMLMGLKNNNDDDDDMQTKKRFFLAIDAIFATRFAKTLEPGEGGYLRGNKKATAKYYGERRIALLCCFFLSHY